MWFGQVCLEEASCTFAGRWKSRLRELRIQAECLFVILVRATIPRLPISHMGHVRTRGVRCSLPITDIQRPVEHLISNQGPPSQVGQISDGDDRFCGADSGR